jgi:hypothetical protein
MRWDEAGGMPVLHGRTAGVARFAGFLGFQPQPSRWRNHQKR